MENMKSENCGPGCDCGKSSGNKKVKAAVCVIVLLSVCGIFVYKATTAEQTTEVNTASSFVTPISNEVKEQSPLVSTVDKQEAVVGVVEEQKGVGESLDSLASLNKVAANQDAVFVFVPAKDNDIVSKEITDAIASAEQKLKAKGIKLGLYTLQPSSPEYASLAAQLTLPGMVVMSKGLGMGSVSGGITEDKILQAYVASSRAGGCGPSGCGPSSPGCSPSAPALGPRL